MQQSHPFAAYAGADMLFAPVPRHIDLGESASLTGFFSEPGYLIGLGTLGSLNDIELNLIAFFEALIPLALNGAVMNEDVGAVIATEEPMPFCVVEPLNCSLV